MPSARADDDPETGVVLRRLEDTARRRRAAEVEDLTLLLAWADLHRLSIETNGEGGERLSDLGGQGTPPVAELALCEVGIARGVHALAARAAVADALDLRHRLPRTWAVVQTLEAEVWVARKVASLSRRVPFDAIDVVDEAVADALAGESPARILELAAAKVIEADLPAHERRVADERTRTFVGLGRIDEQGLRTVIARCSAGDAAMVDAMVARVAEILGERPEHADRKSDQLRALALGWLARPAELLKLLLEQGQRCESDLADAVSKLDPTRLRPRGIVYLHLHEAVLNGTPGVARVEGLGPHTMAALRDLLGTMNVTVKPVIDLAEMISTTAYEHPEAIKERIHLLRPGDRFPRATSMSRRCDLDHPVPYDPLGPPDQTNSHHSQPLSRTPHRAKTHLPYRCTPLDGGEILWTTPHGLLRLVDGFGTTRLDAATARCWTGESRGERWLVRALHRVR